MGTSIEHKEKTYSATTAGPLEEVELIDAVRKIWYTHCDRRRSSTAHNQSDWVKLVIRLSTVVLTRHDASISFSKNTVAEDDIDCGPKTFNDLDFQYCCFGVC